MKIAILGLGMMGDLYLRLLVDLLGRENVIGVDVNEEACRAVAEPHGVRHMRDWRDAIDEVDAVAVTLPDDLHVEPTIAALQAGKYVLVEKPLTTSTSDARRILDAQPAPGRLMVAQILRFDPRLRELKRRLEAEEFGELRYIRIWRTNSTATAARVSSRVSVNGFLGIHDLDTLLWLTGREVTSVSADGRKFVSDNWDLSLARLEMTGGLFAQVENHWLLHPSASRSALAGIQVFGDRGQALLDLSTQGIEISSDSSPTKFVDTNNWTPDEFVSGGSLRRELEAFITAASHATVVPVSGEDGAAAVRVMEMVEAALNSPGR